MPVAGVMPYLHVDIDDEDSLSERLARNGAQKLVDLAVIRLPRISNFTDFAPFERYENVSVRYVDRPQELKQPDMILLPGTKSTIADLYWLRESGLEAAVQRAAASGIPVLGVCGGYQMLGRTLSDPEGVEAAAGKTVAGLGLLEMDTVFCAGKVQTQVRGTFGRVDGPLSVLSGMAYEGYEIHMGRGGKLPALAGRGNVYGTYIHGVFDANGVADAVLKALCRKKGADPAQLGAFDAAAYKERQYDLLAQSVRENLDMGLVYRAMDKRA